MYSCKSDNFAVIFQEISGVRLKNLLVEIFSVFRPYNVAMATTTAVMKATKGIVVSDLFCESHGALVVHRKLACVAWRFLRKFSELRKRETAITNPKSAGCLGERQLKLVKKSLKPPSYAGYLYKRYDMQIISYERQI